MQALKSALGGRISGSITDMSVSGVNGTVGRAGSAAASLLPAAGTVAGARGAAATGNGALTSAQAAAQMALCNGGTGHLNGLMPVRTGLAWATLGEFSLQSISYPLQGARRAYHFWLSLQF